MTPAAQRDPSSLPFASWRNAGNALLVVAAAVPPLWAAHAFALDCDPAASALCAFGARHPIHAANLIFLVCISIGFWLVSIAQRSCWLIDPYWTLIPPMIGHFFVAHPLAAHPAPPRALLALGLLWLWSARLTYNYFRRERGRFGAREDWRFFEMRKKHPRHFWWMALFAAFISQQIMLVGLCLPLWPVAADPAPLGALDVLAAVGCVTGVEIAHVADTTLWRFMRANEERQRRGEEKVLILETGLWRWSRHPNYFGEQLFWWSLGLFAAGLGAPWTLVGAAFNTIVLWRVTVMTEQRMLERPERAAAFEAYRARTRTWLPLPR